MQRIILIRQEPISTRHRQHQHHASTRILVQVPGTLNHITVTRPTSAIVIPIKVARRRRITRIAAVVGIRITIPTLIRSLKTRRNISPDRTARNHNKCCHYENQYNKPAITNSQQRQPLPQSFTPYALRAIILGRKLLAAGEF